MVAIEEIPQDSASSSSSSSNNNNDKKNDDNTVTVVSEERRLDAEAIEAAAAQMTRISARMHLEALAKRLRKESEALSRVEQQQQKEKVSQSSSSSSSSWDPSQTNETTTSTTANSSTPPAATATTAADVVNNSTPTTTAPLPTPVDRNPSPVVPAPSPSPSVKYVPIDKFAFDAGGYNAPFVTLYIDLPGIHTIPRDQIKCNFTKDSFDFIVHDLQQKSYRLCKDNLEKDIDPDKSKVLVKKDRVVIKLAKVKQGDYGGFEYWSQLTAKKSKKDKVRDKENPQASILELMKDMYEQGDDNMKKVIGETMMKQQRGELGNGMGGMDPNDFGTDF